MDSKQINSLAKNYGVSPSRMETIVIALNQKQCPGELLEEAIASVIEEIKSTSCTPDVAVNNWSQKQVFSNTANTAGQGFANVKQEDLEDLQIVADYRGTAMLVTLDQMTANVICNGPTDPKLKEVRNQSRQVFRSSLLGAATGYEVGFTTLPTATNHSSLSPAIDTPATSVN